MFNISLELAHPKPWGVFASSFLVLAVALAILCYFIGKKLVKTNKTFNIFVLAFAALFIFMEITHEVGRYLEFHAYDWSSFPFQLCSVSMYLCIIVPFIKEGKAKNVFITFFGLFTSLSGILPLGFGQGNLTRWPTLTGVIFSFSWHTLLLMLGALAIGYLDLGKSIKKEYKYILGSILIFFVITCVAQVLNVTIHYANTPWPNPTEGFKFAGWMENYELDPDSASLFYISPYFVSNIAIVFDDIWIKAGWVVCWIVYVIAFSFGALVVYFAIYGFKKAYKLIDDKAKLIKENQNIE